MAQLVLPAPVVPTWAQVQAWMAYNARWTVEEWAAMSHRGSDGRIYSFQEWVAFFRLWTAEEWARWCFAQYGLAPA